MAALSSTQQDVVNKLTETGQAIIRLPGGFWTWAGCSVNAAGVPDWWVATPTIRAMERKGLLVRCNVFTEEWRDNRALTAAV
jgi:hypothetical protein